MKKVPFVDSNTGEYNLKFNMQNMMEDFYLPVRGGDTSTRIETTKGLEYDGTNDVQYLQAKLFAALKIPKAYFGYEGDLKFDSSKPNGTPRKLMDSSKINQAGWKPKIALVEGITSVYNEIKAQPFFNEF